MRLGEYLDHNEPALALAKEKAFRENNWFIPEFVDLSIRNIRDRFLRAEALQELIDRYSIPGENNEPVTVGLVMAGNIPLVGFHDLLCIFLTGHHARMKPSSKDEALIRHLAATLAELAPEAAPYLQFAELLKGCDAYIATGSNNTARYFEHYFRNYPSIIRKNRTSVAILNGKETPGELEALADDVFRYFGLGCRNVTKLYVPEGYDFVPLLNAFRKYDHLIHHNKFKNNYDYHLAVHMLNSRYYMSSGSLVLVEDESPFSPISQLHYACYANEGEVRRQLLQDDSIQCVVGRHGLPFGQAQCPSLTDYADGADTISFLLSLHGTAEDRDGKELRKP